MINRQADWTRRDFLKLAGNARVVSSGLLAGCGDWMAAEKIQRVNFIAAEREAMRHGNARALLKNFP